jgi:hypothetical protein
MMKRYKVLVQNTEAMRQGHLSGNPYLLTLRCKSLSELKKHIESRGLEVVDDMMAEEDRFNWIVECGDALAEHWRYRSTESAIRAGAAPFGPNCDPDAYNKWLGSRSQDMISPYLQKMRPSCLGAVPVHTKATSIFGNSTSTNY